MRETPAPTATPSREPLCNFSSGGAEEEEFALSFPTPRLLRASEERKYVPRTRSSWEVWRWAGVDCKDSLQCAAPSWPHCVPSTPGSHQGPAYVNRGLNAAGYKAKWVGSCCQGQRQKRRSGPAWQLVNRWFVKLSVSFFQLFREKVIFVEI